MLDHYFSLSSALRCVSVTSVDQTSFTSLILIGLKSVGAISKFVGAKSKVVGQSSHQLYRKPCHTNFFLNALLM